MATVSLWALIKLRGQEELAKAWRDSEKLRTSLDGVTTSASTLDRTMKGSANATNNSTKQFSKLSQGLGGLVHIYATLAANVFAATAAFNVLRNASRFEQLTQSMQAFTISTGVGMNYLVDNMRKATDGALSMKAAMTSAAQASAGGFSPDQIQRITKVASDASKVLGRDMQDSIDRLTRGLVKLEPELIDELGLMTRVDQATRDYATSVGKSVTKISQFEKRMAFANAVLAEGEVKFAEVAKLVEANPYDRIAASLSSMIEKLVPLARAVADVLEVIIDNIGLLYLALIMVGRYFAGKLFPDFQTKLANIAMGAETARVALQKMADLEVGNILRDQTNPYGAEFQDGINKSKIAMQALHNEMTTGLNSAILAKQAYNATSEESLNQILRAAKRERTLAQKRLDDIDETNTKAKAAADAEVHGIQRTIDAIQRRTDALRAQEAARIGAEEQVRKKPGISDKERTAQFRESRANVLQGVLGAAQAGAVGGLASAIAGISAIKEAAKEAADTSARGLGKLAEGVKFYGRVVGGAFKLLSSLFVFLAGEIIATIGVIFALVEGVKVLYGVWKEKLGFDKAILDNFDELHKSIKTNSENLELMQEQYERLMIGGYVFEAVSQQAENTVSSISMINEQLTNTNKLLTSLSKVDFSDSWMPDFIDKAVFERELEDLTRDLELDLTKSTNSALTTAKNVIPPQDLKPLTDGIIKSVQNIGVAKVNPDLSITFDILTNDTKELAAAIPKIQEAFENLRKETIEAAGNIESYKESMASYDKVLVEYKNKVLKNTELGDLYLAAKDREDKFKGILSPFNNSVLNATNALNGLTEAAIQAARAEEFKVKSEAAKKRVEAAETLQKDIQIKIDAGSLNSTREQSTAERTAELAALRKYQERFAEVLKSAGRTEEAKNANTYSLQQMASMLEGEMFGVVADLRTNMEANTVEANRAVEQIESGIRQSFQALDLSMAPIKSQDSRDAILESLRSESPEKAQRLEELISTLTYQQQAYRQMYQQGGLSKEQLSAIIEGMTPSIKEFTDLVTRGMEKETAIAREGALIQVRSATEQLRIEAEIARIRGSSYENNIDTITQIEALEKERLQWQIRALEANIRQDEIIRNGLRDTERVNPATGKKEKIPNEKKVFIDNKIAQDRAKVDQLSAQIEALNQGSFLPQLQSADTLEETLSLLKEFPVHTDAILTKSRAIVDTTQKQMELLEQVNELDKIRLEAKNREREILSGGITDFEAELDYAKKLSRIEESTMAARQKAARESFELQQRIELAQEEARTKDAGGPSVDFIRKQQTDRSIFDQEQLNEKVQQQLELRNEILEKEWELVEQQSKAITYFNDSQEFAKTVWWQIGQTFKEDINASMGVVRGTAAVFSDLVDNSVDALVDAVASGEGDIASKMKDAIEGSLRESFSNMAKDQLKSSIKTAALMFVPKDNPLIKAIEGEQGRIVSATEETAEHVAAQSSTGTGNKSQVDTANNVEVTANNAVTYYNESLKAFYEMISILQVISKCSCGEEYTPLEKETKALPVFQETTRTPGIVSDAAPEASGTNIIKDAFEAIFGKLFGAEPKEEATKVTVNNTPSIQVPEVPRVPEPPIPQATNTPVEVVVENKPVDPEADANIRANATTNIWSGVWGSTITDPIVREIAILSSKYTAPAAQEMPGQVPMSQDLIPGLDKLLSGNPMATSETGGVDPVTKAIKSTQQIQTTTAPAILDTGKNTAQAVDETSKVWQFGKINNQELMGVTAAGFANLATALMMSKGEEKKAGILGAIGSIAGTVIGAYYGGPQGAALGGQIGGAAGTALGSSFAEGGIMTAEGPVNLYSKGGIARGPQVAIYGEGRTPEAYVPLPDGRSIPVTMDSNAGSGIVNNVDITVNVDNKGQATTSAQGGVSEDQGRRLGQAISAAVKMEILNQKRPGGLLARR